MKKIGFCKTKKGKHPMQELNEKIKEISFSLDEEDVFLANQWEKLLYEETFRVKANYKSKNRDKNF
jgi:hypothetical protein